MSDTSDELDALRKRVRELERALERSEHELRRYRIAFECAPIPMALGDVAAGRALENRALQERMGTPGLSTVDEIIAATHPDDLDEDMRLFAELIGGDRDQYEMDKRYLREDGSVDWAHIGVAICREVDPPITVATLQDINQLKRAEERLSTVTENLPVACVISSIEERTLRYVNPAAAAMFDRDRDELIGAPVIPFYEDPQDRARILELLQSNGRVDAYEAWFVSDAGRRMRLSVSLQPVIFDEERCLMGVAADVTERHEAQQALERAVAHRELLVRETHHRVKNTLQVVSSLLYLQAEAASDPAVRRVFTSNRQRIAAMATIHDALADSEHSTMPIDQLIQRMTTDLLSVWDDGPPIELVFDLQAMELPRDRILPCVLVVNELVSNAFKHAFSDQGGTIRISGRGLDGICRVSVVDDGRGMPVEVPADTLGLVLVEALVRQLQGGLQIAAADPGTHCELSFPINSN